MCVCVYGASSVRLLCTLCMYGVWQFCRRYTLCTQHTSCLADDMLSAHGTLRVLQTAHLVHMVHYVLYKREFLL